MNSKFRFHILGLPHTVSSSEYNACAYTQKVVKFGKMMHERGHYVIHYGHEDSNLVCDEHVTVTTNKDLEIAYGNYDWRKNFFKYDVYDHAYMTFYSNAIKEISKRKQPLDFLLPFWGAGVKPVCDAHNDLIVVEPGIGYPAGHWAKWKIFESYAIMHSYFGLHGVGNCTQDSYHAVIPNYFDINDFKYRPEKKQNYLLYLGRIMTGKGTHIAIEIANKVGIPLIIAGQGSVQDLKMDIHQIANNNIYPIGYADAELRKNLMCNAKALIIASQYTEPFGGVQIEALLSGTPTITSDWGAFAENNIHGVTGYRCRTFDQYIWATKNIDKIRPENCRNFAINNFTFDKVAPMYEEYFEMVMDNYTGKGWHQEHPERTDLNWLTRYY